MPPRNHLVPKAVIPFDLITSSGEGAAVVPGSDYASIHIVQNREGSYLILTSEERSPDSHDYIAMGTYVLPTDDGARPEHSHLVPPNGNVLIETNNIYIAAIPDSDAKAEDPERRAKGVIIILDDKPYVVDRDTGAIKG